MGQDDTRGDGMLFFHVSLLEGCSDATAHARVERLDGQTLAHISTYLHIIYGALSFWSSAKPLTGKARQGLIRCCNGWIARSERIFLLDLLTAHPAANLSPAELH